MLVISLNGVNFNPNNFVLREYTQVKANLISTTVSDMYIRSNNDTKAPEVTGMQVKSKKDIPSLPKADVLMAWAHPDDETCFPSSMLKYINDGKSIQAIYATSGDQGMDINGKIPKGEQMAKHRKGELLKALELLGIKQSPVVLDLPDGKTEQPQNFLQLKQSIAETIKQTQPKRVITFGTDGMTNHPDHITVGKATLEAVREYNAKNPGQKIVVEQVALPDNLKKEYTEKFAKESTDKYWNFIPIGEQQEFTPQDKAKLDQVMAQAYTSQLDSSVKKCLHDNFARTSHTYSSLPPQEWAATPDLLKK